MNLILKTLRDIKNIGFLYTTSKILKYPFNYLNNNKKLHKIFKSESIELRFNEIFKTNYWSSKESVSGSGSTLWYTENLRNKLPDIFDRYSIKTIFDAPCGDLNWMNLLLLKININYIGGDIVKDLIDLNKSKYEKSNINFIHIDLTKQEFPKADLMLCRDCLFHLSYQDTKALLNNFINSGIPYLLTTTHKNYNHFHNKNVKTGDFRLIDLFSAPYQFDPNPLERIDDWIDPYPQREMCLWTRDQIVTALNAWSV